MYEKEYQIPQSLKDELREIDEAIAKLEDRGTYIINHMGYVIDPHSQDGNVVQFPSGTGITVKKIRT